jgi:hypothetical protein
MSIFRSYLSASSFQLEFFNINEEWDEGNGYDLNYIDTESNDAVNWYDRKTNEPWDVEGIYSTGTTGITAATEILGYEWFEKGNENIDVDLTDYINERLFQYLNVSGYTGNTSTGIGIKFIDELENLETINRQAVAFHTNHTHTFFEPYIETYIDDTILDDRYYFYQNKNNRLYLNLNSKLDINVNYVRIFDYKENEISILSGDSINYVKNGLYYIETVVDSNDYPDDVLFYDEWNITVNGKEKNIENNFYIINDEILLRNDNSMLLDNYDVTFNGIFQGELIKRGDIRQIDVKINKLYSTNTQRDNLPLDIEYRMFIKQSGTHIIDVIPFTKVNRVGNNYMFNINTKWLIPQEYFLEVRIINNQSFKTYEPIKFNIISEV